MKRLSGAGSPSQLIREVLPVAFAVGAGRGKGLKKMNGPKKHPSWYSYGGSIRYRISPSFRLNRPDACSATWTLFATCGTFCRYMSPAFPLLDARHTALAGDSGVPNANLTVW